MNTRLSITITIASSLVMLAACDRNKPSDPAPTETTASSNELPPPDNIEVSNPEVVQMEQFEKLEDTTRAYANLLISTFDCDLVLDDPNKKMANERTLKAMIHPVAGLYYARELDVVAETPTCSGADCFELAHIQEPTSKAAEDLLVSMDGFCLENAKCEGTGCFISGHPFGTEVEFGTIDGTTYVAGIYVYAAPAEDTEGHRAAMGERWRAAIEDAMGQPDE